MRDGEKYCHAPSLPPAQRRKAGKCRRTDAADLCAGEGGITVIMRRFSKNGANAAMRVNAYPHGCPHACCHA